MSSFWHDDKVFKSILKPSGFLVIIFALLTLIWSTTFFIHSSEFWSVYISKFTFNTEFSNTILLKPLFHFLLSLVHALPLNDVQHLVTVKVLFSIIGLIQIFLIIGIFRILFERKPHLASIKVILLLLLIFSSTNYLQNFFRIRTDQICTTIFLVAIYLNAKKKLSLLQHFLFILVYPMIGLKGFLFSLIQIILLTTGHPIHFSKNKTKIYLYILSFFTFFIWAVNLSWNNILYLLQTTNSFAHYFIALSSWASSEWILLIASLVSIFSSQFQNFSETKFNTNLSALSLTAMILILLFPQKHAYFLASFSPLFILNTSAFLFYIYEKHTNTRRLKLIFTTTIVSLLVTKSLISWMTTPIYRSNIEQLRLISYISEVIQLNNLNYVDGFGSLPKADNMNCFVSPDDSVSNTYCTEIIRNGKPDIVILTSRLMGLIGPNELLEPNYIDSGYNIFIRRGIEYKVPPSKKMQPALFVFGFEI